MRLSVAGCIIPGFPDSLDLEIFFHLPGGTVSMLHAHCGCFKRQMMHRCIHLNDSWFLIDPRDISIALTSAAPPGCKNIAGDYSKFKQQAGVSFLRCHTALLGVRIRTRVHKHIHVYRILLTPFPANKKRGGGGGGLCSSHFMSC